MKIRYFVFNEQLGFRPKLIRSITFRQYLIYYTSVNLTAYNNAFYSEWVFDKNYSVKQFNTKKETFQNLVLGANKYSLEVVIKKESQSVFKFSVFLFSRRSSIVFFFWKFLFVKGHLLFVIGSTFSACLGGYLSEGQILASINIPHFRIVDMLTYN